MAKREKSYDLIMHQGATFNLQATWKAGGVPVDLGGYTAKLQVRETVESASTIFEMTTENGRISLGGTAGTITLSMAAADTALINKSGVYDLLLISGSGLKYRRLWGKFILKPAVTR